MIAVRYGDISSFSATAASLTASQYSLPRFSEHLIFDKSIRTESLEDMAVNLDGKVGATVGSTPTTDVDSLKFKIPIRNRIPAIPVSVNENE